MDSTAPSRRIGPPRAGIAERIWEAARIEFSKRGYHGARVQGIARGAACNVALIYRHWASKRALYLDILRAVWLNAANEIAALLEQGPGGAERIVGAYLDAMTRDPMGAQVLVREYLDGAPFLSQLTAAEPSLLEPVRRAAALLDGAPAAQGVDPMLVVVTVGGMAALVAAAHEAIRPFVPEPLPPEVWRRHVLDLLTHGVSRGANGAGVPGNGTGANGADAAGAEAAP
jgi:AcrR family transcriptional regulator